MVCNLTQFVYQCSLVHLDHSSYLHSFHSLLTRGWVQAYIERTESFRGERKDKILLSYVKPHSPILSSTLVTRWVVTLLKLAEKDTDT